MKFLVFKMGINTLLTQGVSILRAKKGTHEL